EWVLDRWTDACRRGEEFRQSYRYAHRSGQPVWVDTVARPALALETELHPEQREYLGMVRSSAEALLGIINDILDFSKIEAGKMELEETSFCLEDCIEESLGPLGIRAMNKGL